MTTGPTTRAPMRELDQDNSLDNLPVSKQRLRVWLKLLSANRAVESQLRESLRQHHATTLPRFDVLATLDRYRDGLRMSGLSAHLKVSNGNVTGIVDKLVTEGLVTREITKEDKRATKVRLTEAGQEKFTLMAAEHEKWVDDLFADLDSQDLAVLTGLLSRIKDARP